ncbi:MAG: ATP-dependent Clp protease ATP-binding subunit, partial [Oscillospiraceae bacterium]|nr:ATP-dependent Clp protease ATP-binding subunit [Oscillospiraceae bacterium]
PHLKEHIIGQDEAITALAKAIKRSRVQMTARRRPASFIFVGPTGVGKTELVKVLSAEMFDSTEPLIRLDMTEYMEKHAISRMIGSPPGYVGYDEAGQLTEKVRRRPYSVILFDEIEKAHPDVMNLLLQILDEGKIDDAQGRTVNFENTIIIMTSNAGSTDKSTGVGFNRTEEEISKEKALKALKDFLRPEFVGRIDEIIVFKPLSVEDYARIAALMLKETAAALSERGILLDWDDAALKAVAEKAHGHRYGARDIRRVLREDVEDPIASMIVDAEMPLRLLHIRGTEDGVKVESEE